MATFAELVSAMQDMEVTGVVRYYDEPPESLDLSGGPCAFPLLPSGGLGERLVTCHANNKKRAIQYVIVVGPVAQGTNATNYRELATLMDNLETALDGEETQAGTLANFVDYEISAVANYAVGDVDHWAIVADVAVSEVR